MLKIRLFSFTFFLLLCTLGAFAQQVSTIKGKVTTSDGKPAAYITVGLKGKGQGATTDDDGKYTINRVKPGTYTLRVSAVGINTSEKSITVSAGQNIVVDFVLQENDQALEDVTIAGINEKYKVSLPSATLRLNEPLLEAPQNIQVVSSQAIKDQQIISMSDGLIRNVSGAVRLEHWGDMYTNILMRGSQIQAMRNGFNVVSSYWGPLTEDLSFVDHIEFVKGPAGFMLGNGDPSGMYNVVTKKPTGLNQGEVSFTAGSYDLYRTTIDLDHKLTADGKFLFRLNAAAQNKASFRPFEHNDRYSFAPVLSYQITPSTKLTAEYTLQNAKMTEVGSYYLFSTKGYASLPRDFTNTQPGVQPTRINDHSLTLNLQQQLGANWKLTAQAAYYKYLQTGSSSWPSAVYDNGTIIRNVGIWDAESTMKLAQLFINGTVETGGIVHRILAGFDGGEKNYMADWGQSHDLDLPSSPFNLANPYYGFPSNGYPNFDRTTSLEQRAIAAGGLINSKYLSGYVQDELGFWENKIRLTLAGRYTYVSQSAYGSPPDKAKHVTPRVGLSVSVDKNTSVYALYDEAFTPQSGFLRDGSTAEPITGNNKEIGIKKDWFDGRWNTTLSVYRIMKQNELAADPSNAAGENFSVVVSEKRAQGIEFDLRGEIVKGLNLIANYAYTDGKVTKVADGLQQSTLFVGQVIPGFAKHTSNAWLTYSLQNGTLKGFGISGGFTYLVDRATANFSPSNPEQNLPDYFKLDGGLFWANKKLRINANVFNLLDKYLYSGSYYTTYWNAPDYNQPAYSWQAEAPRNYRVTVAYKF
ncbi:TonB-dependent siderophore receptor [Pedobacter petrophilus]|uniref:TonB-dependent siderophore receptor n=1 Tax=Pedobacter petrophilus TaxID=1908241 RepID=A0A7K0FYF4_9SPHI|nr:TonB-dependent receptor [Pedobacter petrophilus]MRX76230.1 TonB-dependent siderophore receptor [Pedobacter petrophilus]